MRSLNPNILIFLVYQSKLSQALNFDTHAQVMQVLKGAGVPVLELEGVYNGSSEKSILVDGFEHRATVERLCKEFNQECYLESHNDRATSLVFPNGTRQAIGTLQNVSQNEAKQNGSYSYNPKTDLYFVTK